MSHTAVNAILGRLTRAGIVLAERQGSAVLSRANRDHVGWDRQQQALRDLVRSATGNDCQIMEIDVARLLRHVDLDDPLVSNWLHDGVLLSGIPLAAAIETASAHVRATS